MEPINVQIMIEELAKKFDKVIFIDPKNYEFKK